MFACVFFNMFVMFVSSFIIIIIMLLLLFLLENATLSLTFVN